MHDAPHRFDQRHHQQWRDVNDRVDAQQDRGDHNAKAAQQFHKELPVHEEHERYLRTGRLSSFVQPELSGDVDA